jgi:hypothetical protein
MTNVSLVTATNVLKTLYGDEVAEAVIKDAAFAGMMKEDPEEFDGLGEFKFTVQYGTQQGHATNYPDAELNAGVNKYLQFNLPRGQIHAAGFIDGDVLLAGAKPGKGRGAMVNVFERERDGLKRQLDRSLALVSWGNGGGAIGRIGATTVLASDTIVLATPEDHIWFENGQYLQFAVADGTTGALKAAVSVPKVIAVVRGETVATVKLDTVLNVACPTIAAGDHIFWRGYHGNTAGNHTPVGWSGYIPDTDPGPGDNFLGADRSADPMRLAGLRYSGGGGLISETLQRALAWAGSQGVKSLDTGFAHPMDFADLLLELQDQKRYVEDSRSSPSMPNVGFSGCKIVSPFGKPVGIFADAGVKRGVMRLTNMNVWRRKKLGKMFHIVENDGVAFLRVPGFDTFSWRHRALFNHVCLSPWENVNVTLLA